MFRIFALLAILIIPVSAMAQDSSNSPKEMMAKLRLMALDLKAEQIRSGPSASAEKVYGVVMDWPLNGNVVTVVSFETGDCSMYTTSTFGALGGIGHAETRDAAKAFVSCARTLFGKSTKTTDFSYPDAQTIRFYLLTTEGVRKLDYAADMVNQKGSDAYEMYDHAQNVVTAFRLISQKTNQPPAGADAK